MLRNSYCERRYLADRRRSGSEAFPAGYGARRGAAEHPAIRAVLPRKLGGFYADCDAAVDHYQRNAGHRAACWHRLQNSAGRTPR